MSDRRDACRIEPIADPIEIGRGAWDPGGDHSRRGDGIARQLNAATFGDGPMGFGVVVVAIDAG
ncbi:MAG TPA: hypothetical protein VIN00_03065, partial [Candidatus Dormibacteraeota bacterium]